MSISFNVSQLLKSGVGGTRWYDFESDKPLDLDGIAATQVHGHVKFTLTNFGILAAVEGGATLEVTCGRCLEPFGDNVEIAFDEEYLPSIDIETGLPASTAGSDTAFTITQNHQVDLSEALRQHFLLAVEMVPVCRPDCKGLCPTCGVNRNIESCECPSLEPSSPFEALQSLLVHPEHE